MSDVQYLEITAEEDGQRLDNYLLRMLKGVPKSHIYRIIRGGEVRVNKKRAQVSTRIVTGDRIRIPPIRTAQEKSIQLHAELIQCLENSVLYEDERLLVINKPSGMAVHGGSGLSLGVIEAYRKLRADLPYLELVHRLDRETSGVLLLAKKRSMLRAIQALLESRTIEKTYWALAAHPWTLKKSVVVNQALEKNTLKSGERMVVINEAAKPSETIIQLLENYSQACLLEAKPKTGRTHQIRVHCAYLGHPIIGDEKYGATIDIQGMNPKKHRLYLHARSIQFTLDDRSYAFQADLDERFTKILRELRAGII